LTVGLFPLHFLLPTVQAVDLEIGNGQFMIAENYLGDWTLIPELSIYQKGTPPRSGKYSISRKAGIIWISIVWTDLDSKEYSIAFGGQADGIKRESDAPGVTHVSYSEVDENTLDSSAYNQGHITMYARRVVSNDGQLLAVSQTRYLEDGNCSNFQVYRRQGT
jgi:hypothetical protein